MNSIGDSLYHKTLRICALTAALLLLFVSGVINDATTELADITTNQLANAVGVSVGVAPTELNTLTAEFSTWQRELATREAAVREREIAVGLNTANSGQSNRDWSTFILATILFILLLLIVLNYALDYMRRHPQPQSVPTH